MQILRKRILACFMVAFLSLFSVFFSYEDAQASASGVIGGGAVIVGTEYAFAWLLGTLGLTAASVAVYENADSIKSWGGKQITEFKNWMEANVDSYNEWADLTSSDINVWIDELARGTLNKTSAAWRAFRDYVGLQYIPEHVGGGAVTDGIDISALSNFLGIPVRASAIPSLFSDYIGEVGDSNYAVLMNSSDSFAKPLYCQLVYGDFSCVGVSDLPRFFTSTSSNFNIISYVIATGEYSFESHFGSFSIRFFDTLYLSPGLEVKYGNNVCNVPSIDAGEDEYAYVGGISDVFDRDNSFDNVDLVGVGAGADAVEIPINWGNVGEKSGVLSGVAAGTVPWTDALSSAGVGVVDLSHDTVIGDEGETDEPIAGVVTPPTSTVPTELENYTVSDLSKLFPFCIPFDLINFFDVLSADPEAPHFTWTFSYPTLDGMQSYDLQIDLSAFDSIAELLRDMECILFIVGLILITRDQMIKG